MLQYLFLGFYEGDFDSNVISSFKEALKFSRVLFSILGDFALDGPATIAPWSTWTSSLTKTGEIKPSLTFSVLSSWIFFLFWLLVVNIL